MANAIHKSKAGDTLESISREYYALSDARGGVRDVALIKVTNAIRANTPTPLDKFKDGDELPAGTVLHVPTLRELNRVVLTDNEALGSALRARGFDHARKLLRYSPEQIVEHLSPLPSEYSADDVTRARVLTAYLSVDGVDPATAIYLYDEAGLHSMKELAAQSPAALARILETLVKPPHERPKELTRQGHAKRWVTAARIQTRARIGELTKIKGRYFQVPFSPSKSERWAEFYEGTGKNGDGTDRAALLGRLYRFQAAVLRGNTGLRSGNNAEAIAGYREARREWHRMAETLGVAEDVQDEFGINHDASVETAKRMLETLDADADSSSSTTADGTVRTRLRGFRYGELKTETRRAMRQKLAEARIHQLPELTQSKLDGAILDKTIQELKTAHADIVEGLSRTEDSVAARELDARDKDRLRDNLHRAKVDVLFDGENGLKLFDRIARDLELADVARLAPSARTRNRRAAVDVLNDEAKAAYPTDFLDRKADAEFHGRMVLT